MVSGLPLPEALSPSPLQDRGTPSCEADCRFLSGRRRQSSHALVLLPEPLTRGGDVLRLFSQPCLSLSLCLPPAGLFPGKGPSFPMGRPPRLPRGTGAPSPPSAAGPQPHFPAVLTCVCAGVSGACLASPGPASSPVLSGSPVPQSLLSPCMQWSPSPHQSPSAVSIRGEKCD